MRSRWTTSPLHVDGIPFTLLLLLLLLTIAAVDVVSSAPSESVAHGVGGAAPSFDVCVPETCFDEQEETFFSYTTCCDNECCSSLRFWVYPASIAAIGFVAGAFFALCFQCR